MQIKYHLMVYDERNLQPIDEDKTESYEKNAEQEKVNEPAATAWKKKLAVFLSGQAISLFGSALVQFAVIWSITIQTGSGLMLTISTLCAFLPQILISVFAGVWADRINRKKLIIFSDGMIALSTLVMAILFFAGLGDLWLLFLMLGIRSLGAGIQSPAVNALIPQIVPTDKLIKVNGINSSIHALIMVLSPAISGLLLSVVDLEIIFFVDVFTAIIAIAILLIYFKISNPPRQTQKKYFDDLLYGFKYISKHGFVIKMIIYSSILMFLVVPVAFLAPLQITRLFGGGELYLAINEIAFSSGAIFGGIIIVSWGGFKNRIVTICTSCFMFGFSSVALGFTNIFTVFIGIMAISGIFLPFFNTPSMTLLQEKVESEMHGRVFGVVQILSSAAMPIGMMLFGPLSDIVSINLLLIITGAAMVLLAVVMLLDGKLRNEGKPALNETKN